MWLFYHKRMLGLCPILSCIYWDDHVVFKYFILLIWVLNQHWNSLFLFFFQFIYWFFKFKFIYFNWRLWKSWKSLAAIFCCFLWFWFWIRLSLKVTVCNYLPKPSLGFSPSRNWDLTAVYPLEVLWDECLCPLPYMLKF